MVLYTCGLCFKIFNKKCDYIRHTEHRKTPCKNITSLAPNWSLAEFTAQNWSLAEFTAPNLSLAEFSTTNLQTEIDLKNNNINDNVDEHKTKINEENMKINKVKCEYCNKFFTKQYGLNRHLLRCNIKRNISEKLKVENENLKIENEKLKNEKKIKDDEVEKLKIENEKLNNAVIINKPVIINNNTINNNNININIVNYGEEDLSKLDINKILQYDNSFIEMVFRDIHCNSELPENQNILLPSLTRYDIYIKLNNEWLKRNKKEILTERYTTIRGHIMDLYDKDKEINKAKADNAYFNFLKQIKLVDPSNVIYKPQEEKKIIDGMANVLYNHKNNIKSIIKTPLLKKKKIIMKY